MSDESQELIGKVLKNRYEILKELGRGGMAIVYLCKDQDLDRKVVVKAPKKALAAESEFRQRFEREIRGQLGLEHPHICKVMDAETSGPFPYVVLQYLSGGDLNDKLKSSKEPMSMKEIMGWMPQVAKALDFIHSQGWVHRDVKPGNTMFDEYGNAYVGDFGIARAASSGDMELTQTGALIGSPQYMAPDLMLGHELSPAYDQYALACMVYTALSKRIPHQASTPIAIVHLRAIRPIPPLSDYVKGVPKGIEAAVMKGLERDPKDRFGSCEELYEAIHEANIRGDAPSVATPAGGEEPTMMIGAEEAAGATRVSGAAPGGSPAPAAGPGVDKTVMAPPPKKSAAGKLVAAAATIAALGVGGFFGFKALTGGEPPALTELAVAPGAPVFSVGASNSAAVSAGTAELTGRFAGRALKEIRGSARPHSDKFYSNLPTPDLTCSVKGELDFSCAFEGQPGRYEIELIASDGWSEARVAVDLKVGDSGLVPLPPNDAGQAVFERIADGARVVEIPGGKMAKADYLIDEHEVSWRQFFRYLQAEGKRQAAVPDWATLDSPAVNVDWDTANAYCAWASARLPTADEWRQAAAGDEGREFPWGGGWEAGKANTADPDGRRFAAAVREFREGASPYGVLNMVGNVAEWVSTESRRGQGLVYGGSFRDRGDSLGATHAEAAARNSVSTSYGMRCAMGGST